jgi:hypothetical protein
VAGSHRWREYGGYQDHVDFCDRDFYARNIDKNLELIWLDRIFVYFAVVFSSGRKSINTSLRSKNNLEADTRNPGVRLYFTHFFIIIIYLSA